MSRPASPAEAGTFAFAWEPVYRAAAAPFGVRPHNSGVTVTATEVLARFGPWSVSVARDQVDEVHVTGGYTLAKTIGPAHLSFKDRGLTFATNRRRGLCIHFRSPVRGIDPFGRIRHPALTVTVADPAALARALGFPEVSAP